MQEMQVNLQINRLVVVLAAVLGAVTLSASVGNYRFTHITSRDGLPHQQVQALANDGRGQLWIGTRNGLSVYDGYEMLNYYNEAGNQHSLWENHADGACG